MKMLSRISFLKQTRFSSAKCFFSDEIEGSGIERVTELLFIVGMNELLAFRDEPGPYFGPVGILTELSIFMLALVYLGFVWIFVQSIQDKIFLFLPTNTVFQKFFYMIFLREVRILCFVFPDFC